MPDFVVQEHIADRAGFHHDLRLEDGGALESWAIPKGIPITSGAKRLAIHTHTHPLDYKEFEGEITEGYGKGTVRTFDIGEYTPIAAGDDYRLVQLRGNKLRGNYYLRRMKGNRWLIWKRP